MIAAFGNLQIGTPRIAKKLLPVIPLPVRIRILGNTYPLLKAGEYRWEKREVMVAEDGISLIKFHLVSISLGKTPRKYDLRIRIGLLQREECRDGFLLRAVYEAACVHDNHIGILSALSF